MGRLRGTRVTLPVAGNDISVKIGDKVIVSLRTKDAREAKSRFKRASAAIDTHFDAVCAGPKPLTFKQVVALAGDAYRQMVLSREDKPIDCEAGNGNTGRQSRPGNSANPMSRGYGLRSRFRTPGSLRRWSLPTARSFVPTATEAT